MQTYYIPHLAHHGIEGQKWGVHNGPPYPIKARGGSVKSNPEFNMALKNLRAAKMSNVDKWGKDAEHNTLYIVGLSGSGKSTTARGLTGPNDTVIHLDNYLEYDLDPEFRISEQSEKFNRYLDKTVPKWKTLSETTSRNRTKEYWDTLDSFKNAIDSYSIQEFRKGNKVVAEGVQFADGDYWGGIKEFSDRPLILLKPDKLKAVRQAERRDNDRSLLSAFIADPQMLMERLQWYGEWTQSMNSIAKSTHAKKGKKYVNDILRTIGATKL